MNNWKVKFARWMQGRRGPDELNTALTVLYLIVFVLNLFSRNILFYSLMMFLPIFSIFRLFSKNLSKRAEENRLYLQYKDKVVKKYKQLINRWKERNTHRYRTCPKCHTTLRLQKKIGKINVHCPVCHEQFTVDIKR